MKRRALLLPPLLAAALLTGQAGGQALGEKTLEVKVGATERVDVGQAVGLQCDDTSIATASLTTVAADGGPANQLTVTGLKAGATLCRVGTVPGRPFTLYRITVVVPDGGRR